MVSHFAMLPFLLGIGYFLLKIGDFLIGKKNAPWLLLLCFADPVLAGQSVLVSPDITLVFFFLLGGYSIWIKENNWLLMLAVTGLGLTSMRGMMVGIGLFIFSLPNLGGHFKWPPKLFLKKLMPFVPGGLLAVLFLFYHWQQTGWIGHHPDSPWAPSFAQVDIRGLVKNIGVLGWRMLDFGRIFICLAFLFLLKYFFQKELKKKDRRLYQIIILSVIIFIVTIPTQLMYKGLLAHRYFLPFFISLHFLIAYLIFGKNNYPLPFGIPKKWFCGILVVGLITGNLWVYPKKISQGWDSTLAHLPWYGLIEKAQYYLQKENIDLKKIGTAFPNIGPREWYELDGREFGFKEKDFDQDCFILYSNIMNDFSDAEINDLENNWSIVYSARKMGVCLIIYENPKEKLCEN